MRRLILLSLALVAAPAYAQETYSIPATAPNVIDLASIVATQNLAICRRLSTVALNPTPAFNCSQAQACLAAVAPGGSSCTAAQARGADVRIYPATQAGREEYVTFKIAVPTFKKQLDDAGSLHQTVGCEYLKSPSGLTDLTTLCSNAGLPAPPACFICR